MERYTVFADESGTSSGSMEDVVVLATVIASESQVKAICKEFDELKQKVSQWGIDTSRRDFEFHTYDLFHGNAPWWRFNKMQRLGVLFDIRNIAVTLKLPYGILLIDKRKGAGNQGLAKLTDHINAELAKKDLSILSSRWRRSLERLIPARLKQKRRDLGSFANPTALLLGLTTGLMQHLRLSGSGEVIADRQFLKHIGGWKVMFRLLHEDWPTIAQLRFFESWPADAQPQWHLGDEPEEVDSYDYYGVQLADFVAYTTRRMWINPLDATNRYMAIIDHRNVPHLPGYPGFFATIPRWAAGRPVVDVSHRHWRKKNLGL